MPKFHPDTTDRKAGEPSNPIEALPPFVSKTRTGEVLCISRATVWRCIKDGRLEAASGSGLITKASILRFAQPVRVKP